VASTKISSATRRRQKTWVILLGLC
jgi:hypothetical protein